MLISKVSRREVFPVIINYGIVASSDRNLGQGTLWAGGAGLNREDLVFGAVLVKAPVHVRLLIERLLSPEDLKGRILLKVCFLS